jgi:hypothetical protein
LGIGVFLAEDIEKMKIKVSLGPHHLCILFAAFLFLMPGVVAIHAKTSLPLLETVVSLKLGMNGYVIGQKLNSAQKELAGSHSLEGAYQDTYKFADNDLYVVVDQQSDRVLALYKQTKDASRNQLKAMVVELMDRFNAPTTMAHDKILYWAFNEHGAISEEDFNTAKKIKQTTDLNIIATVKLNSEMEITPDPEQDNQQKTAKKSTQTGSIYFIITSDPMVQEFINSRE